MSPTSRGGGRFDSSGLCCVSGGAGHADKSIPYDFYQAQGHVVITRSDSVTHDLIPHGDTPTWIFTAAAREGIR